MGTPPKDDIDAVVDVLMGDDDDIVLVLVLRSGAEHEFNRAYLSRADDDAIASARIDWDKFTILRPFMSSDGTWYKPKL